MIKTFFDLDVYRLGNDYSMKIYLLTRSFPKSETYSLTSQIVDSSRSICANIAEGWGRRVYESEFKKFLVYSMGSLQETKSWLNFAVQCKYINDETFKTLMEEAEVIGGKLFKLHQNWKS
ncbi:four helix bundle protein [Mucilaginibacter flavidus]|uniref:four helix bundle protein n=1 Tax=Mucilaginibacter flavidus TaxID=2949309 RepID=UPI002092C2F2|nr:four helix bundle protein [Mucilaginibacter flavidus]MCO5949660.1 four helix bundle protein [Mucilaginibacter flavidus]